MGRRLIFLVCLSVGTLLCGCAAKMHLDVPLVWKPSGDSHVIDAAALGGLHSQRYEIQSFVDARENKTEIAKNKEDGREKIVTTRDDVGDWCRNKFESIVKGHGLHVVQQNASVIIKGDVLQFHVTEENIYKANVGVRITAENAAGKVLWQGTTTGKAQRFGRSYEMENYHETLSDAYLDAVNGLLKNPEFQMALQTR